MPEIEKNERTAAPIGRKTVAEAPAPAVTRHARTTGP